MLKKTTNAPLVSVIIANHNGELFLERCLKSILAEKNHNCEIIVVDDGSTDDSLKLLNPLAKKDKRLIVIINPNNVGAAQARNNGFNNCRGKFLFFLDNDTEVKEGWFDGIIKYFKTHQKVGLAQTKLLKMGTNNFDYAGDRLSPFGFLIERAREATDHGQFDNNEPIFALKSAGMIARRNVFEELGGFDSDYQIFWEDTDIAWRTWLIGWQVGLAYSIIVWHAYGTKEKSMNIYVHNRVVYRGCRNMIVSLTKNLGTARLIYVLPINILCWLTLGVVFLIKLQPGNSLAILRGVGWNLININPTLFKRRIIQQSRKINDTQLFSIVGSTRNLSYYFGKAKAYVLGKPF